MCTAPNPLQTNHIYLNPLTAGLYKHIATGYARQTSQRQGLDICDVCSTNLFLWHPQVSFLQTPFNRLFCFRVHPQHLNWTRTAGGQCALKRYHEFIRYIIRVELRGANKYIECFFVYHKIPHCPPLLSNSDPSRHSTSTVVPATQVTGSPNITTHAAETRMSFHPSVLLSLRA